MLLVAKNKRFVVSEQTNCEVSSALRQIELLVITPVGLFVFFEQQDDRKSWPKTTVIEVLVEPQTVSLDSLLAPKRC